MNVNTPSTRPSENKRPSRGAAPNKKNRNAPRASLACVKCRERKIKCDVQTLEGNERCTPCRSSCNECIVRHDDDRKWRASKNYIVTLEERIRLLEGTIRSTLNQAEERPWIREKALETMSPMSTMSIRHINDDNVHTELPPLHSRRWSQPSYGQVHPMMTTAPLITQLPTSSNSSKDVQSLATIPAIQMSSHSVTRSAITDHPRVNLPHANPLQLGPILSQIGTQEASVPSPHLVIEKTDSVPYGGIDEGNGIRSYPSQLSTSTAILERPDSPSYEDDRQVKESVRLRCFGPTCPLHVLLRPNPPVSAVCSMELESCMPSLDSEQLRKELLSIFWNFQPLSIVVVNQEMFMEHLSYGTTNEYYSDFLLYSILACAVRLSTRIAIRSLSSIYYTRAKSEIATAMEHASIATIQGFCLLSDFEMSSGRDQAGWLYAGIACRILFDLGLHQDCSDLVRTGHLSEAEAAIRRQVFFSCLVNERLWCYYLGRPTLIKTTDFSTPRLRITDSNFQVQSQAAWVDLLLMSSEICDIFNCPSLVDEVTIRKLIDIDTKLHSWYHALPKALTSDNGPDTGLRPEVMALHMQFFGIQVLVHRTSIMTTRKFSPAAFTEKEIATMRGQTLQQSRSDYHDCAVRIARLLAAFKERVGLERTPTVMLDNIYMATIALISYASREGRHGESYESDLGWMILLLDALEALQVHYPVATRMRYTLSDVLRRGWLGNSPNSPLHHKLLSEASDASAKSKSSTFETSEQGPRTYNPNKPPPIFDTADLWIIPEDYGIGIGYPQFFDCTGQQSYNGVELDQSMIDTSTYAVNGMDLLEM